LNLERLAALAQPRKPCEEDKSIPCKCPPKAGGRKKRGRNKLRIMAMVEESRQQACEEEDPEEGVEDAPRQEESEEPAEELMQQQTQLQSQQENMTDESQEETSVAQDAPVAEPQKFGAQASLAHQWHLQGLAEDVAAQLKAAELALPPLPPQGGSTQEKEEEPQAAGQIPQFETSTSRPEPKPRGRAVARARSLGATMGRAEARAAASGLAARTSLSFEEAEMGLVSALGANALNGPAHQLGGRRPRVPVGLPKGAAAALLATGPGARPSAGDEVASGTPTSHAGGGGGGPLWKAVPIKVMQFDFGL